MFSQTSALAHTRARCEPQLMKASTSCQELDLKEVTAVGMQILAAALAPVRQSTSQPIQARKPVTLGSGVGGTSQEKTRK